MYRVVVHRRAARYLQRLPQPKKERIKNVLAKVALDPFHGPDVRPMVGQWAGYYRLRIGEERIIFWVERQEVTIYVDPHRSAWGHLQVIESALWPWCWGCF